MGTTSYVVLEEHPATDSTSSNYYWSVYAEGILATSTTSALRTALNGQGNLGTRYVAVPERSWKPQPVEVETQHRLKIG